MGGNDDQAEVVERVDSTMGDQGGDLMKTEQPRDTWHRRNYSDAYDH